MEGSPESSENRAFDRALIEAASCFRFYMRVKILAKLLKEKAKCIYRVVIKTLTNELGSSFPPNPGVFSRAVGDPFLAACPLVRLSERTRMVSTRRV